MTATPLPWRVSGAIIIDASDHEVATVPQTITRGAQASHDLGRIIVRAVNAHDELVTFVADVVEHLTRRGPIDELTWRDDQRFTDEHGDPLTFVDSARALLARLKADSADLP